MTQTNATCAACLQLQQRIEEQATSQAKTLECYAGLHESAVPVIIGDHVLGYLQTGQVLFGEPSRVRVKAMTRTFLSHATGAGPPGWQAAYFQTRIVVRKDYQMVIRLLAVFAEHLSTVSNRLLLGRNLTGSRVIAKSCAYIAENFGEPIRLRDAARAVGMSPFYFCKVFKRATGLTFTEYLSRVRIESVKEMLLDADMRISEAAYAAGFQSLSQFNRVFHRLTGEAPTHYREQTHAPNHNAVSPIALAARRMGGGGRSAVG